MPPRRNQRSQDQITPRLVVEYLPVDFRIPVEDLTEDIEDYRDYLQALDNEISEMFPGFSSLSVLQVLGVDPASWYKLKQPKTRVLRPGKTSERRSFQEI